MDAVEGELADMAETIESFVGEVGGGAVAALVRMLMAGGVSATAAYRLSAAYLEAQARGWGALGVPVRTAYRWKSEVETAIRRAGEQGFDDVASGLLGEQMDASTASELVTRIKAS